MIAVNKCQAEYLKQKQLKIISRLSGTHSSCSKHTSTLDGVLHYQASKYTGNWRGLTNENGVHGHLSIRKRVGTVHQSRLALPET